MSSALHITVLEQKGSEHVTVLHLKGELDGSNYKELESRANELVADGASNFLVDLSGVSYMGSAGLRAFHSISNAVKGEGGAVKLLNPSDAVARILKTLGFDQFFQVYTNLDEALDSF
ncbi:MAG: STAS domain-containing protein [Gammaproteobacteria bacterium]|nr:STAS domain-containing protein [Gammaproteobacteria bacterium]